MNSRCRKEEKQKTNSHLTAGIKPRMYGRRSTMYMYEKAAFCYVAGTGVRKISTVACGFSSLKFHRYANRINEVDVCVFSSIK